MAEEARIVKEARGKRTKKVKQMKHGMQVKMGHGGTLDPMATGVLILGVGSGTKSLQNFLGCTKSYEAVLLFGRATDSYDSMGKVVARKPFEHVTREKVEAALGKFRGKIMQRPPIFSALRVDGKRLYEYAREGKALPREIEERPVEVKELEITEWMEGGTHEYHWPEAEAGQEEKVFADKILHFGDQSSPKPEDEAVAETIAGDKRKRGDNDETIAGAVEPSGPPSTKRTKSDGESMASGALPADATTDTPAATTRPPCPAPACRIRMTVTSGFYVRSFCHDLGAAVDSLGLMAELSRTRQGDFELGKNVFEYGELAKGEEVWAPQVRKMLDDWQEGHSEEKLETRKVIEDADDAKPDVGKGSRSRSKSPKAAGDGSTRARRNSSSVEP